MAKTESTRAKKTTAKAPAATRTPKPRAPRAPRVRKTDMAATAGMAGTVPTVAKLPRLPKVITAAIRAAQAKKAQDIVVLDLRKADAFTDFFIICTGQNARQMSAVADGITDTLREELDERPFAVEGSKKSEWVLVDYFTFVVHIFSPECRVFYDLERLWGAAVRHVIPNDEPDIH